MDRTWIWAWAKRAYRRLTPATGTRALVALPLVVMALIASTVILMGLLHGADAALTGEAMELAELRQVEHEVWTDMGDADALTRSVWGLFHWFVALTVWLAVQAAKVGYAMPFLGTPAAWVAEVVPFVFLTLLALQAVRVAELTVAARNSGGTVDDD